MRIAFLSRTAAFRGGEKHLVELLRRIDLTYVQPIIFCFDADPFTRPLNEGLGLGIEIKAGLSRTNFLRTWSEFRKKRLDEVVFVSGVVSSYPWYTFLAAHLAKSRRVIIIHHNFSDLPPPYPTDVNWLRYLSQRIFGWRVRQMLALKIIVTLTDRIICVSDNLRKQLVESFGYPAQKTVTVHNGVDLAFYATVDPQAGEVRKELGISPDEVVLVCACQLVREKGVDVLLRAVALIQNDVPALKCVIVGEGPSRKECEALSAELGLASRVSFVGFKNEVRPYFQAGDFFVLPSSPTWVECLPLAVLEAMACGLPCIASNVGGVPEIISDQEDGLLVTPGSVEELRTAIKRLATNCEERKLMGARAKEKVRRQFDIERCVEQLKSILLQ